VKEEYWKNVIDASEALCHISGEFFAQNAEIVKYKRAKK
jgi:hypothetical protein